MSDAMEPGQKKQKTSCTAQGCGCLAMLFFGFLIFSIATSERRSVDAGVVEARERSDFEPRKLDGAIPGDDVKKVENVLGPSNSVGSTDDLNIIRTMYPRCRYAYYPIGATLVIYNADGKLVTAGRVSESVVRELKSQPSNDQGASVQTPVNNSAGIYVGSDGRVIPRGPSGDLSK